MQIRSPLFSFSWLAIVLGSVCFAQELDAPGELEQTPEPVGTAELAPGELSPLDGQITEMTVAEQQRFAELDNRAIHASNNVDLAEFLSLKSKAARSGGEMRSPRAEAGNIARRTLGQPFRLNAVQLDPAEGDCVSCVNRQLALSLAWDWQSYVILIERIRHKDGIVEYKNRNFFTLQDWLPNNTAWLLDDITGQIGPAADPPAKRFTYPVRAKLFDERPAAPGSKFVRITFKGWDRSDGKTEVWPSLFIPSDRIYEVTPDLMDGDVVMVLRKAPEGHLDCDHVGMIVRNAGGVELAHCVPPHAISEPLDVFLGRCHWVVGLKFLRLRENAREIAAQEVERLAPSVPVLSAADQDRKNEKLRAARLGSAGQP